MTVARWPCLIVLAAIAAGCQGAIASGAMVTDAASPRADAASSDATSVGACDPVAQDCPPGQTCDLVCEGLQALIACRPVPAGGGTAVGGSCRLTDECGAASGCYEQASVPSSCVRYCAGDADCPTGTCQEREVARGCVFSAPHFTLKLCLP